MTAFAPPADLSRQEWEGHFALVSAQVNVYSMDTPDGRAINPQLCPGPLAAKFDGLIVMGLERGWFALEDGQPKPVDA